MVSFTSLGPVSFASANRKCKERLTDFVLQLSWKGTSRNTSKNALSQSYMFHCFEIFMNLRLTARREMPRSSDYG